MAYTCTVIETNGDTADFWYKDVPPLSMLRDWVGGDIESVPFWDEHEGKRAWVICNEHGKWECDWNPVADTMWKLFLRKYPKTTDDALHGNVVIIACDTEEDFRKL